MGRSTLRPEKSFAVERSQELLHDIGVLLSRREIPDAMVFVDSPLARKVTQVFIRHAASLEDVEVDETELFRHPRFRLVHSVEESKAIKEITSGAIIISASGMCDFGRIKHHLKDNIWRQEATVLFGQADVSFQERTLDFNHLVGVGRMIGSQKR